MSATENIEKLTDKWYRYVNLDHHKDRDCHWYIEIDYAYGDKPTYTVRHFGYIADEVDEKYSSLSAAYLHLELAIEEAIRKEKEWVDEVLANPEEYDQVQTIKAKAFKEIFR